MSCLDSELKNLDAAIGSDEDCCWAKTAMHNPSLVSDLECYRDLQGVTNRCGYVERLPLHGAAETRLLDQLPHNEQPPVPCPKFADGHDVWVVV